MKKVTLFLLCALASFSSYGDTLAQFLTKDSEYPLYGRELDNLAAPVENLTVGKLQAGQISQNNFVFAPDILTGGNMLDHLLQKPVLAGFARFDGNYSKDQSFSICSLSMTAGSGSMIKLESFSFNYSQLSQAMTSSRAVDLPRQATPAVPMEFTLMASINGGEYISLQTLSVAGGTDADPWVLGKNLRFDLSSAEIQAKIGSATSIQFDLRGKFGDSEDSKKTYVSHLAFDNISVDGTIVPYAPSVPEPSSALLCLAGLPFLLRRKRNR